MGLCIGFNSKEKKQVLVFFQDLLCMLMYTHVADRKVSANPSGQREGEWVAGRGNVKEEVMLNSV